MRRSAIVTVFCILSLGVAIFVPTAGAYGGIVTKEGGKYLLREGGSIVREWTPKEWKAWEQEVRSVGECVGMPTACASNLEGDKTAVQGPTVGGSEDAAATIAADREAGASLSEFDLEWADILGESEGSLPSFAEFGPIFGDVLLGGSAFTIGVAIGNGLDQVFGLPEWHPFEKGEEEEARTKYSLSFAERTTPEELHPGECLRSENECLQRAPFTLPAGTYEQYTGSALGYVDEWWNEKLKYHREEVMGQLLPGFSELVLQDRNGPYPREGHIAEREWTVYAYKPLAHCSLLDLTSLQIIHGEGCAKPRGVPKPGLLTPAQQAENELHGFAAVPTIEPATLPTVAPSKIDEEKVTEITPLPGREHAEEKRTHRKQQEEEEGAELVIPDPGNELATEYVTQLETEGFTDVHSYTVSETAINTAKGPNEVAAVSPAIGSQVAPSVRVDVAVNPADAPIPSEGHVPIGGPTLPGIKLPQLGLLCKTMPFGVPCWLIKQIEAFSGSSSAPVWKIGPFDWAGNKIPAAEIHLSAIEPIMEIVRPFMVLFGTIGIVLLFYRIFTGKGLGGGENPAGQVPGPEMLRESDEDTYL